MKYEIYEKVISVEYQELEDLIEKFYGRRYDIPIGEEANKDTSQFYPIDKSELGEYDLKAIEKFIKTGEGCYL